jgi:hypothetical protein
MEIKKARTKKQNDILRKEILTRKKIMIGAVFASRQHDYDRFTSNRHLVLSKPESLDQLEVLSGSLLERPGRCSGGAGRPHGPTPGPQQSERAGS